jgi:hypothetical protein
VTKKLMEKHGGWKFMRTRLVDPDSHQSFTQSIEWGQAPCRNIVKPPKLLETQPNSKIFYLLDRKIELAIRFERRELEKAILYLPNDWKVSFISSCLIWANVQ